MRKKWMLCFCFQVVSLIFCVSGYAGWEPPSDSRQGGQPKSEEAKIYFDLRLTDDDKIIIRKIVTTLAEKNLFQLLLDKEKMEDLGQKIRPVHPMRFIGFVLGDPNLRRCLKVISKNMFKWDGFLDGYQERMREESRNDNLNRYVPGLSDYLEVDRTIIQSYIHQGNYEKMIKYFF
jgi:hypothetical protein